MVFYRIAQNRKCVSSIAGCFRRVKHPTWECIYEIVGQSIVVVAFFALIVLGYTFLDWWYKSSSVPPPYATLSCGLAAFWITWILIGVLVRRPGSAIARREPCRNGKDFDYRSTEGSETWRAISAAHVVLGLLSAVLAYPILPRWPWPTEVTIAVLSVVAGLVIVHLYIHIPSFLRFRLFSLRATNHATFAILLFATIEMLLALPLLVVAQVTFSAIPRAQISQLFGLRERMQWLLVAFASMNALAVFAVATMRGIVLRIEVGSVTKDDRSFPREAVFLYGVYLTAIISAAYLPDVVAFDERVSVLVMPARPDPSKLKDYKDNEDAIALRGVESFQTAAGIFAPVLASVIAIAAGKVAESKSTE